jgi:hypothetical protein
MVIMDKLQNVHDVNNQNNLALAIELAIHNKKPIKEICISILDWYNDTPQAILDIIGEDCLTRIKNMYEKKIST